MSGLDHQGVLIADEDDMVHAAELDEDELVSEIGRWVRSVREGRRDMRFQQRAETRAYRITTNHPPSLTSAERPSRSCGTSSGWRRHASYDRMVLERPEGPPRLVDIETGESARKRLQHARSHRGSDPTAGQSFRSNSPPMDASSPHRSLTFVERQYRDELTSLAIPRLPHTLPLSSASRETPGNPEGQRPATPSHSRSRSRRRRSRLSAQSQFLHWADGFRSGDMISVSSPHASSAMRQNMALSTQHPVAAFPPPSPPLVYTRHPKRPPPDYAGLAMYRIPDRYEWERYEPQSAQEAMATLEDAELWAQFRQSWHGGSKTSTLGSEVRQSRR